MMAACLRPKSLTAQIRDAERQVLNRQRGVGVRTATLVRNVREQMTAPATLWLAGGIGFIIGELTKRQTLKGRRTADKPRAAETTPLRIALNLMTSIHTLYTALPLALIIKSFQQPGATGKTSKRQFQPAAAASGAVNVAAGDQNDSC